MGLILDTSILIDAERRRLDLDRMLAGLERHNSDEFAISAVSLMELAHGLVRARSRAVREVRKSFLEDLRAAIPAFPVDDEIAIRAGELDGSLR